MAISVGEIMVSFGAETSGFRTAIKEMTASASEFGSTLGGKLALGGVAIAGLAVVAGVATTKMAGDFQASMTQLVTGAGESAANIGKVSQAILDMAQPVGTTTGQLAAGMFMIESAGYRGAAGLDVLKMSAMGAKVGNADLGVVANATTTIMKDFASTGITAAGAVNELIVTVANGKTHMADLASSLSTVLPTAASAKIGLNDVMGAMATMTGEGVPAAQAATYLRQTIMNLVAPGAAAKTALESVGLTSTQVASEMQKSLPSALAMITDAIGKKFPVGSAAYMEAIKTISGGSKTMQGMLDLTGTHMADLVTNTNKVASAVKSGGNAIIGWSTVQEDFNFKADQAKAALEKLGITIGTQLLPFATSLMGTIGTLVGNFTSWLTSSGALQTSLALISTVLGGMMGFLTNLLNFFVQGSPLATVLSVAIIALAGGFAAIQIASFISLLPTMIGLFGLWAVGTWSVVAAQIVLLATNPIFWIGVAVVAVIAIIIICFKNWGAIVTWLQMVWTASINFIINLWHTIAAWAVSVFNGIGNVIRSVFGAVTGWIGSVWNGAISFIIGIWNMLRAAATNVFNGIVNFIRGVIQGVISWLVGIWNNTVNAIVGFFQWLYAHNTYWQMLVDAIRNIIASVIAWLTSTWQAFVAWITGIWNGMVAIATTIWNTVSNAIHTATSTTTSWTQTAWGNTVKWLGDRWATMKAAAGTAWDGVKSVFSAVWGWMSALLSVIWAQLQAWFIQSGMFMYNLMNSAWAKISTVFSSAWSTYISGPLTSIGNNIKNFLAGLISSMINAGAALIQGIATGMMNAVGAVVGAAKNIAGQIFSFLGFHSSTIGPAEEGPGRTLAEWGPGIANGIANGMLQGLGQIRSASFALSEPIAAISGVKQTHSFTPSQQNQGVQNVYLQVDGRTLAQALGSGMSKQLLIQLNGAR